MSSILSASRSVLNWRRTESVFAKATWVGQCRVMQIIIVPLLVAGALTVFGALAQVWPLVLLLAAAAVADRYLGHRKRAGGR